LLTSFVGETLLISDNDKTRKAVEKAKDYVLNQDFHPGYFIKKDGLFYRLTCYYEKLCYDACDEILVTTDKVKELISEHYDIDKVKMHVIPNGVDTSVYRPLRKKK
jgi:glycosyltransferase involved in cell wall biosynthesis